MKVDFDISFLIRYYRRHGFLSAGVFRVIESLLAKLISKPSEIELYISAACHQPIIDCIVGYSLFSKDYPSLASTNIDELFDSKLGIMESYSRFYNFLYSNSFEPNKSLAFSLFRILRKTLLTGLIPLHKIDNHALLGTDRLDIFHSTYLSLPSRQITQNSQRAITIYDLIPAIRPDYVPRKLSSSFSNILSSIDIHRDWVICISEYTKKEFCEYTGMEPERIFVTHLSADNDFFPIHGYDLILKTMRKYSIPEYPYFLSIAALQPRKNLSFLIESFYNLISENHNIDHNLVLAGSSGWMTEEIFEAINSRSDLKHRIHFTGYVEEEDLNAIYNGATAFIFPSLYEGFGLPILEAMQAGVPVISSNATSLPEVAGDAAILADPQDEDAFCQAMLNIIHDSSLRQRLKYKGLEQAKKFSWDKCADQTLEAYRVMANNKNQ